MIISKKMSAAPYLFIKKIIHTAIRQIGKTFRLTQHIPGHHNRDKRLPIHTTNSNAIRIVVNNLYGHSSESNHYLPPFASSLIMHVLTNAEKLIPRRDAASLAESRKLAGIRIVTGTTSPFTRYERISVSPASCSIRSEYVIAFYTFKLQYKCNNSTPAWEQRKASEVFQIVDDRGHPTLPVLSATQNQGMIYRDDSGRYIGHDESNEIGYKRVLPGDFVVHLRSFQGGFAHSQYEGITSPAYTVFRAKEPTSHSDRFWKHWFMSEHFIAGLSTVTYGIRDGRSISVDEFMNTFLAFPAVEEQAAISRLFDYLDDLITLHQRKRLWFAK